MATEVGHHLDEPRLQLRWYFKSTSIFAVYLHRLMSLCISVSTPLAGFHNSSGITPILIQVCILSPHSWPCNTTPLLLRLPPYFLWLAALKLRILLKVVKSGIQLQLVKQLHLLINVDICSSYRTPSWWIPSFETLLPDSGLCTRSALTTRSL